jgi:hypothetical protein
MIRALALAAGIAIAAGAALATPPNVIAQARYAEPTTRYDHGILGDAIEWGALELTVDQCSDCDASVIRKLTIRLPDTRVFEDTAPRLVDADGDGAPEVMVVETDLKKGARLALYDEGGLIAATPFIGRTHRWLAPLGAADLDGDGQVELAYVDRPHLARTIRIWRYVKGSDALVPVTELRGFTNHRIGDSEISGGIRDCGNGPELIVADSNWQTLYSVTLRQGTLTPSRLGPLKNQRSFQKAMACKSP